MPAQKPFAVLPLRLSGIATGNAKSNRPATHLALPQYPGMRWESTGSGNLWVRGQFDGTQAVNFVSLMGANALPGTTIRVRLGTTQAEVDGTAPYDSTALPFIAPARTESDGIYHSHLEPPSVVNASWWRIDIGGHAGDFAASALVMGLKRTPAYFYNRDREMGFEDLGEFEIARNGVLADTPGVVLRTLLFRLAWVSEGEWFDLWQPFGLRNSDGSKQVIYWCFDPDPDVRRQAKSYLGFMARDIFNRGNDVGTFNTIDVQFRGMSFPPPPPPSAETVAALLLSGRAHSGMWDARSAVVEGGALTVPNISGLAGAFAQPTVGNRPAMNATTGLLFDGTDDELPISGTLPTGVPFSFYALVRITGGGRILRDEIFYTAGNGTPAIATGTGTVAVNGVPASTRGDLDTALRAGGYRILSVTNFDVTNPFAFGRSLAGGMAGDLLAFGLLRESEFPSNLAAARSSIVNWLTGLTP